MFNYADDGTPLTDLQSIEAFLNYDQISVRPLQCLAQCLT